MRTSIAFALPQRCALCARATGDASAEVLRLVSRELDRAAAMPLTPGRVKMPLPAAE